MISGVHDVDSTISSPLMIDETCMVVGSHDFLLRRLYSHHDEFVVDCFGVENMHTNGGG